MSSRSTLSTVLLAFYLLVAGGLPLADALIERVGATAWADVGQGDRERGTPHDESCALCILLDRVAGANTAHGPALSTASATERPAGVTGRHAPPSRLALVNAARAPPRA